ncbi:MAG: aspartate/glutamate racemase family protein [Cypionkella sp.]
MMRQVSILGGMGPEAIIPVVQTVLAAVKASDEAHHLSLIVDQNPQVPSRIRHLNDGGGKDPGPVLATMARRLVAGVAEALEMPCNAEHHCANAVRSAVDKPLLDMVEPSVAHAATLVEPGQSVGILASHAVRKVGLFDAPQAKLGLSALYARKETAMLAAIRQLKTEGAQPMARQTLTAASDELLQPGAVTQLIACTEFSLIADEVAQGATAFDTLDVLVGANKKFAVG